MAPYKTWRRKSYKRRYKKLKRKYKKTKVSNATSRSRTAIRATSYVDAQLGISTTDSQSISQLFNPFFEFSCSSVLSQPHVFTCSPWTSDIVQLYQKLYDEVKCDSFMVEVTVATPIGVGGEYDCVRLYTAWDRKGCYNDTYYNDATFPGPDLIRRTGSCASFVINNNSPTTVVRYCKASDFLEKYSFIDASSRTGLQAVVMGQAGTATCCEAWINAQANMTWFSPTFMCFIGLIGGPPSTIKYFRLAFRLTAVYTFRCPKFTAEAQLGAKLKRVQQVLVPIGTKDTIAQAVAVPKDDLVDLEAAGLAGPATAAAVGAGAVAPAGGVVMRAREDPVEGMIRPERIAKIEDYKAALKALRMEGGNITDQPSDAYYFAEETKMG